MIKMSVDRRFKTFYNDYNGGELIKMSVDRRLLEVIYDWQKAGSQRIKSII